MENVKRHVMAGLVIAGAMFVMLHYFVFALSLGRCAKCGGVLMETHESYQCPGCDR